MTKSMWSIHAEEIIAEMNIFREYLESVSCTSDQKNLGQDDIGKLLYFTSKVVEGTNSLIEDIRPNNPFEGSAINNVKPPN